MSHASQSLTLNQRVLRSNRRRRTGQGRFSKSTSLSSALYRVSAIPVKRLVLAALAALALIAAPAAHADPAGNAICRLLAAGNTPSTLESSVTVRQVLGPDATDADARVYIRSVVAGQCPQFLWRW